MFCVEIAPNPFQEAAFGILSHYMKLSYTQFTYTMLYYALLYYIVLYFAMVEMTPNPFQEDGFGIPSHYREHLSFQNMPSKNDPILTFCFPPEGYAFQFG